MTCVTCQVMIVTSKKWHRR